jgi:hypothetical protein
VKPRALIAIVVTLAPSLAQAMSVAEFLTKADALKASGMFAMMSSDIRVLGDEVKAAGTDYRADVTTARAQGRTDLGCPPPKGQVKINTEDLLNAFRAVPAPQRAGTSVKTAFYRFMKYRFPCK